MYAKNRHHENAFLMRVKFASQARFARSANPVDLSPLAAC
jgi:hypothetical protein